MIDVRREADLLSLKEVARMLKVTPKTVRLWASGKKGGARLETFKVGGARRTSLDAVQRFTQQSEAVAASVAIPRPVNSDYERAMLELRELHGAD